MPLLRFILFLLFLFTIISLKAQHRECDSYTIYFKNNRSILKGKQKRQLDSLDQMLQVDTSGIWMIKISGHTDTTGNDDDNLVLSRKRAEYIGEYIKTTYPSQFEVYEIGRGSHQPKSADPKANRRTEIQLFRLNDNGTVSFVNEDDSSTLNLRPNRLLYCDLCDIPVSYKLGEPLIEDSIIVRKIEIESECLNVGCFDLEFRLPFDSQLLYSEENIPYPVIRACGDTAKFRMDTTFRYPWFQQYLDDFTIRIDTSTSEFVISHPCYYANYCMVMACGTVTYRCDELHYTIDQRIQHPQTNMFRRDDDTAYWLFSDTHQIFGDSNVYCVDNCWISNQTSRLRGYGWIDGEIRFLNAQSDELEYTYDIFTTWYRSQRVNKRYHVPAHLYKPLEYGNLDVLIKVPRVLKEADIGLSLSGIEYYIPVDHVKQNKFFTKELMYPHEFYILCEGERRIVSYETAKIKFKKRKKRIKVKIKSKHIQDYLELIEIKKRLPN